MLEVKPRQSDHKRRKYVISIFFRLMVVCSSVCGCDELPFMAFSTQDDTSGAFPSGVAILATVLVTLLTEI